MDVLPRSMRRPNKFLGLTDYILSDYARHDGRQVNLYVAYYASQRTGLSPHSPSVCIPGNGWQITDLATDELPQQRFKCVPAFKSRRHRERVK